jgi:N-acetylmuramoyl-L-alanine amidase
MKTRELLVLHCTATPEGSDRTAQQIRDSHILPPPHGRGWKQVGYSELILLSGEIKTLVPYDIDDLVQPREITNGAAGFNAKSLHVAYVGGVDKNMKPKDTRTPEQIQTQIEYLTWAITVWPDIKIVGHGSLPNVHKACPSYNVREWLKANGFPAHNTY